VILLYSRGRILGISGIIGSLLQKNNTPKDHYRWRIYFLVGIVFSSLAGGFLKWLPELEIHSGYTTLVMGGLLVGVGTRMGSGCTSGHAVCGMGRLSLRSLIATLSFMFSGFVTAYIFYHIL